jgi:hypothetical protein
MYVIRIIFLLNHYYTLLNQLLIILSIIQVWNRDRLYRNRVYSTYQYVLVRARYILVQERYISTDRYIQVRTE